MRSLWPFLLLSVACPACPDRPVSAVRTGRTIEITKELAASTNRNVDILFVIDNSTSTADKQNVLAANFPRFIETLAAIPGGLPSVHIGVVSSDVGIGGRFTQEQCSGFGDHGLLLGVPRGDCPTPNDGARFIADVSRPDGTRTFNYPAGRLPDVFSCIARLGTTGCGFEQPLEAMKQALDGSNPENAGFLREDAYLAVIILADEDDCSARDDGIFDPNPQLDVNGPPLGLSSSFRCTQFGVLCDGAPLPLPAVAVAPLRCEPRADSYLWHPQHYIDFLRELKGDPNLLIGAVIAGSPSPFAVTIDAATGGAVLAHSCSFDFRGDDWVADPAVRLADWASRLGSHGTFVSVCQSDFSEALTDIGHLLGRVLGPPCLDGPIDATDIDATEPGLQLDCQVADVFKGETVIPRCPMTSATTPVTSTVPCFWTAVEPAVCTDSRTSPTQVALHVERGGAEVPIGSSIVARCAGRE